MDSYKDYLTGRGATLEKGRVRDFGTLEADYDALNHAGLVPLLGVTPLRLTGSDRLDFLHGQVTNEVKRLNVGGSSSALMLNVKGHALALMRIFRREDDLFVAVEDGAGAEVLAQFKAHIIFDQVTLENLEDKITTLTLQGSEAEGVVTQVFGTLPPAEGCIQEPFNDAKVLISRAKRSAAGGFDLHVLLRDAAALFHALTEAGATPAGEGALELHRVEAAIPTAAGEGGEGVLPQEAGLESHISYRKGCYLGQEIMARIEARGNLRRELVRLTLPQVPQTLELSANGKTVGRLGTVVQYPDGRVRALAVLRNDLGDASVTAGELPVTREG